MLYALGLRNERCSTHRPVRRTCTGEECKIMTETGGRKAMQPSLVGRDLSNAFRLGWVADKTGRPQEHGWKFCKVYFNQWDLETYLESPSSKGISASPSPPCRNKNWETQVEAGRPAGDSVHGDSERARGDFYLTQMRRCLCVDSGGYHGKELRVQ